MNVIDLTASPEFGATYRTSKLKNLSSAVSKKCATSVIDLAKNDEGVVLPPSEKDTLSGGSFDSGSQDSTRQFYFKSNRERTNVEDRQPNDRAPSNRLFDNGDRPLPIPESGFDRSAVLIPRSQQISVTGIIDLVTEDEEVAPDARVAVAGPSQSDRRTKRPSTFSNLRERERSSSAFENGQNIALLGLPNEFVGKKRSPCESYSLPVTSSIYCEGGIRKRKREDQEQNKIQTIYNESRRPVKALKRYLDQTVAELQSCGYKKGSQEWIDATQRKEKLTEQLSHAEQNASECVFSLMNSNPFEEDSNGRNSNNQQRTDLEGYPIVDLHGLHVREAVKKFEELVKPFLSSVGTMTLITGWGKHSKNGKSALQISIIEHIRRCGNIEMEPVPNNRGRVRVKWVEGINRAASINSVAGTRNSLRALHGSD